MMAKPISILICLRFCVARMGNAPVIPTSYSMDSSGIHPVQSAIPVITAPVMRMGTMK